MSLPEVGVSREVIAHHGAQHPCNDDIVLTRECPCGECIAIVCGRCDSPVFVCVKPGTWCVHAQQFLHGDPS